MKKCVLLNWDNVIEDFLIVNDGTLADLRSKVIAITSQVLS